MADKCKDKKKTITLDAKEITGADVTYISLVARGANRVPFRILKSEDVKQPRETNGMSLNINTFLRRRKSAQLAPALVAFVVRKEDAAEAAIDLAQRGFKVDNTIEHEGAVTFKQEDYSEVDVQLVALGPDLMAAVRTTKGFDSWPESLTFADNMAVSGFYPGINQACDALMSTLYQIMQNSSDPAQVADLLGTACDDFKAYAVSMAGNLPVDAFKMDGFKVTKSEPATTTEAGGTTDIPASDSTPETTVEDAAGSVAGTTDQSIEGEEQTNDTHSLTNAGDAGHDVNAQKSEVLRAVQALSQQMTAMSGSLTSLTERVEKGEQAVAGLSKSVKGTVLSNAVMTDGVGTTQKTGTAQLDEDSPEFWNSAIQFPGE